MTTLQINGFVIDDATTLHFAPNPKRPHANVHARYEAYSKATTLAEYKEFTEAHDGHLKNMMPSLKYDEAHGYLTFRDADDNLINIHEE